MHRNARFAACCVRSSELLARGGQGAARAGKRDHRLGAGIMPQIVGSPAASAIGAMRRQSDPCVGNGRMGPTRQFLERYRSTPSEMGQEGYACSPTAAMELDRHPRADQ